MSNYSIPGNDYVSVAKFRIEGVHEWQARDGETDASLICAALDAQTQATLGLAYEQRTANLIALVALDGPTGAYTGISSENACRQIIERLGLA